MSPRQEIISAWAFFLRSNIDFCLQFLYNRGEISTQKELMMKQKKRKTIALIAHDNKKAEIVNWALKNKATLEKYDLCGTGTTAKLISEATDLTVKRYLPALWAATCKLVQR